jgi:hypothetical protein
VSGMALAPSAGIDLLRVSTEGTPPRWLESNNSLITVKMAYADRATMLKVSCFGDFECQ